MSLKEGIMTKLSHFDKEGKIKMVDVSAKVTTSRRAVASAKVLLNKKTIDTIRIKQIQRETLLKSLESRESLVPKKLLS